ncbi:MAG: DinB family protein [Planctomycetota bacterium]
MIETLVWSLRVSRQQTVSLVSDLDDAQMIQQPRAGMNHPAWTLGHLYILDAYLADAFDRAEELNTEHDGHEPPVKVDESWQRTHSPKSRCTSEPGAYRSKREYLDQLESVRVGLLARLERLGNEDLKRSTPDPSFRERFPTLGHLLHYALWHEAYHAGQLAAWRRAMDLPDVEVRFEPAPA